MMVKKVTAIVRSAALERVEQCLRETGVSGLTVSRVKGFGEYANFFRSDWHSDHARLEIFTDVATLDAIVAAIADTAYTGHPGDGIIAVLPVDRLYRIRDRTPGGPQRD